MEKVWRDPVADFMYRLHNQRVDQLIPDIKYLQYLRRNYDEFKIVDKHFGYIFEERGINLLDLVVKASCVPNPDQMDEEDEQKMASFDESPGYASPKFENFDSSEPFKFAPSIPGGLLDLLPSDLTKLIEIFVGRIGVGPSEPPTIVPEWDHQGNYGSLPVQPGFPLFA